MNQYRTTSASALQTYKIFVGCFHPDQVFWIVKRNKVQEIYITGVSVKKIPLLKPVIIQTHSIR